MDLPTLFPDSVLRKAEEDISKFEDRGRSHALSAGRKTKLDMVTDYHKLLCKSSQEPLTGEGITSAYEQKCSRVGEKSRIPRLL